MFKQILQQGKEVLHRCIDGERVSVDSSKIVDVDHCLDPSPDGPLAPPGEGGESPPPSSSSSLASPLDGRRVSPLFHGLHGSGGARAPLILDLSLCYLLFHAPEI